MSELFVLFSPEISKFSSLSATFFKRSFEKQRKLKPKNLFPKVECVNCSDASILCLIIPTHRGAIVFNE